MPEEREVSCSTIAGCGFVDEHRGRMCNGIRERPHRPPRDEMRRRLAHLSKMRRAGKTAREDGSQALSAAVFEGVSRDSRLNQIRGAANPVAYDRWAPAGHRFIYRQPPRFAEQRGHNCDISKPVDDRHCRLILKPEKVYVRIAARLSTES